MAFSSRRDGRRLLAQKLRAFAGGAVLFLVLLIVLPLLVAALVLRLPAALLEAPLLDATRGLVRLTGATGNIGDGRGELWVRDFSRREWVPWQPVSWRLDYSLATTPAGRGAFILDTSLGTVTADRAGVLVTRLASGLPPGLLLEGVDHPLAKAHWQGDVDLASERLFCYWLQPARGLPACDGVAVVRWRGAASSILPLREFGDYLVTVTTRTGDQPTLRADVNTERGVVVLKGFASATPQGLQYRLSIKGERTLIGGLDNVAGPRFKKQPGGDEFVLDSGG